MALKYLNFTGLSTLVSDIKTWVLARIPTKTSEITNDSGFLTSHQSLSNYSTLANTIKSLSISGKTITYTKGNNTTGTLTTQDTNTDTLMTQNVSTANATYPVLLVATADATANQGAKTGIFAKSVKVNPNTNVISASGFSGAPNTNYVQGVKDGGAVVNSQTTSFGAIWRAPTKNYQVAEATFPSLNDEVYICYSVTNDNVTAGTNTTAKRLTWNAGTGTLTADVFSGFLTGNVTGNCSGSSGSCTGNAATATTANESLKVTRHISEGYVDILQTYQSDNNDYRSCSIRCHNGNGYNGITLGVHDESNGAPKGISVTNTNGTLSTSAPTPATSDNSTQIATTAYVKAQGYLTSINAYLENSTARDANAIDKNGITWYSSNGPSTSLGASVNDGALYTQYYNNKWIAQIAQDYRNGNLFTRGKNNGTWQAWKVVAYHGDNISKFTNDAGYLTSHQSLSNYSTLANTVKSLSISDKTITVTPGSGSAYTLTTQDTVYTHPTTAGNKHIPSGGAADQYLKYSASGTAVWADLIPIFSDEVFRWEHTVTVSAMNQSSEWEAVTGGYKYTASISLGRTRLSRIYLYLTTEENDLVRVVISNGYVFGAKNCVDNGKNSVKADTTTYGNILTQTATGSSRLNCLFCAYNTTVTLTITYTANAHTGGANPSLSGVITIWQ